MQTVTKIIRQDALSKLTALVASANRRATKLGLAGLTLTHKPTAPKVTTDEITGLKKVIPQVEVTIVGAEPKLAGWRFLATIEHLTFDDGSPANIIRAAGDGIEVPEHYRTVAPVCEHCKTNRRRNDTYLVQHDDGRLAQVGSTCIGDFLGTACPEDLIWAADSWGRILAACEEGLDLGFGGGELTWNLEQVLALTAAIVDREGWVSKAKATILQAPTAELVRSALHDAARGKLRIEHA